MQRLINHIAAFAVVAVASGAPAAAQQHASPSTSPGAAAMNCPMHSHGTQDRTMGAGMGAQADAHWEQMHSQMQAMRGQMQAMHTQMQSMHQEMMKLRQQVQQEP